MSEVQHTPGPWSSQGWVPTWAYIPVKDAAHNLVATVYPDLSHGYTQEQANANANLIAAAPEMLHALEMVRDANRSDPHIPSIALAIIEAAIAKAIGAA